MKRIAFVATREPEYSRVAITKRELNRFYELDQFVCSSKSYPLRMIVIAFKLLLSWMTFRLRKNEAIFVGFLAQPILPLVRLLYRGPIVSDAYFSLYDAMVNDKQKVKAKSLTGRFCYWLDRFMLRHSELCFTDTQQHVDYLRSFFKVPHANISRLWISAESQPLKNQKTSFEETNANSPTFHVFFWGGFIPLQGVDTIVRAASLLAQDNVQFTIFGTGQTLAECQELQTELGVHNIDFKGWQSPHMITKQAQESHVALGIFGTTEKAARVIPNKAYEALAMGIPLITRRSPAASELLLEDEHCLMVDSGSPQQLAEKIRWAKSNYDQTRCIANNGQQLFQNACSPKIVGQMIRQQIDKLLAAQLADETKRTVTDSRDDRSTVQAVDEVR